MKKNFVLLSALASILSVFPVTARAQYLAWHYDRLIEANAGYAAYEPQIAISGSKAVAVWCQSDGSNRRVYSNNSIDGGKTWHTARLIEDNNAPAYHPHVAIAANIAVAVWMQWHNSYYRIYANYSIDGGKTWHADQMIQDETGGHALDDGPLVSVSGTRVVAAWSQSNGSHYRIYANYSTDGGKTWHARKTIDNATAYDSGFPSVALSGTNAVIVWPRSDGSDNRVYSNWSADGGATWNSEQSIEDNSGRYVFYNPQVVMTGTNALAVWYQEAPSGGDSIYANYSTDGGKTWHSDQTISAPTKPYSYYPGVAMSGTKAVAVWMQYDTGTGFTLTYSNYSTDSGATWQSPRAVEANTPYAPGLAHVALSGSNVVTVWRQPDGSGNRVFTNYSTNGGASWVKLRALDGIAGTTASDCFPKIAISGNKAIAVWVENDGVSNRIVSNYASFYATDKYFLRPPKLSSPANGVTSLPTTVTLSWQDTNDPSGPQELKYKIRIKVAGGTYTNATVAANSTSFLKSGLKPNKVYYWNVQAVGNGTSVLSSPWANGGVDWKFTTNF